MAVPRKEHGVGGPQGAGARESLRIAPGGDPAGVAEVTPEALPGEAEQVRECQAMNLTALRTVFAAFRGDGVNKKLARGASMVFRGVSGQLRALEYGQRE